MFPSNTIDLSQSQLSNEIINKSQFNITDFIINDNSFLLAFKLPLSKDPSQTISQMSSYLKDLNQSTELKKKDLESKTKHFKNFLSKTSFKSNQNIKKKKNNEIIMDLNYSDDSDSDKIVAGSLNYINNSCIEKGPGSLKNGNSQKNITFLSTSSSLRLKKKRIFPKIFQENYESNDEI